MRRRRSHGDSYVAVAVVRRKADPRTGVQRALFLRHFDRRFANTCKLGFEGPCSCSTSTAGSWWVRETATDDATAAPCRRIVCALALTAEGPLVS